MHLIYRLYPIFANQIKYAPESECSLIVVCTLIGCCRFKNVFWPRHQNKQIGSFDVSKTHTIYGHLLTFYVFSVTVNIYINIIQLEKYFVAPQLRLKFRKLAQGRDMHPTSSNCTIVNITTYILLTMNEMNECYVCFSQNKRVAQTRLASGFLSMYVETTKNNAYQFKIFFNPLTIGSVLFMIAFAAWI